MRASSARCACTAWSTGSGMSAAPALLRGSTAWQPGVSARARSRSRDIGFVARKMAPSGARIVQHGGELTAHVALQARADLLDHARGEVAAQPPAPVERLPLRD